MSRCQVDPRVNYVPQCRFALQFDSPVWFVDVEDVQRVVSSLNFPAVAQLEKVTAVCPPATRGNPHPKSGISQCIFCSSDLRPNASALFLALPGPGDSDFWF